jgi:hypothetical protein
MHTMVFPHGPRFRPFSVLAKCLFRYTITRSEY